MIEEKNPFYKIFSIVKLAVQNFAFSCFFLLLSETFNNGMTRISPPIDRKNDCLSHLHLFTSFVYSTKSIDTEIYSKIKNR